VLSFAFLFSSFFFPFPDAFLFLCFLLWTVPVSMPGLCPCASSPALFSVLVSFSLFSLFCSFSVSFYPFFFLFPFVCFVSFLFSASFDGRSGRLCFFFLLYVAIPKANGSVYIYILFKCLHEFNSKDTASSKYIFDAEFFLKPKPLEK